MYLSKGLLARWKKAAGRTGHAGRVNDFVRWCIETTIKEAELV